MLDIKALRADAERFLGELKKRDASLNLDDLLNLDKTRREKLAAVEKLKNQRNTVSKEVGLLKAEGRDASELVNEMKEVNAEIKRLDEDLRNIEEEINGILLHLPNLPHETVPVGARGDQRDPLTPAQPPPRDGSCRGRRNSQPGCAFLGHSQGVFVPGQSPLGTG